MKILFAVCATLITVPAAAHSEPGAAMAFTAGLLHPLTGADHLLAMLGIGLWGRQQQLPELSPAFLAAMVAGAVLAGGAALPVTGELSLAGGVALVGALLAVGRKASSWAALALVVLLGLLHGQAHAAELPTLAGAAGFLITSAALLMAGRQAAMVPLHRTAGIALGVSGVGLLASFA